MEFQVVYKTRLLLTVLCISYVDQVALGAASGGVCG